MIAALHCLDPMLETFPRTLLFLAVFLLSVGSASAQRAPAGAGTGVVTGLVMDSTGGVLANAHFELKTTAGALVQSGNTDDSGAFRIERVASGRYDLSVAYEGFEPTVVHVTVGTRALAPVRITLALAGMKQEITVSSGTPEVNTTAANNLDAVTVDLNTLESLPVFDQDYVATMSQFLDSGSIGSSGVTVVVNGMEVNGLNVSASAVQQIKINQDPYSAEYSRPGRGRIEILTKPGTQQFHGEGNVIFRDAQLNGRNVFATVKPPEQRRIFEGFLGGPVGQSGKSSFMLSLDDDADDQQAVIFALDATGRVQGNVPQPNHHLLLSGSITHQQSASTTISIRPSYEDLTNTNRGVGGVTLASAGTNFEHSEEQVTYNQQSILKPSLLNQFQILVGQEREPLTSVSPAGGVVVSGSFIGGGAQADLLRTEHHFQMAESVTWTKGQHLVQAGIQIPDFSRRRFDDQTNFGGTFYFSNLAAYQTGQPYSFIQQRGNGHVVILEKVIGLYLKDDWQVAPNLTASAGLRYDWENYFNASHNFAPRGSFAFSPGSGKKNVIRGGAGVFYDKTGPVPTADMLHFQPGGLQRVVLTNPGYPDPYVLPGGVPVPVPPPSTVQFAPDIRVPFTVQYSLGFEQQLQKTTTVAVTYIGSQGYDLFRSRDINAPTAPFYLARPNPAYGAIREIESAGRQKSDSVQVTLRGRVTRWFNGHMQYTLSRTENDTGGLTWYPANDDDLAGEWARADFDRRHRFLLLGRVSALHLVDLGAGVNLQSGTPYSETVGGDPFNNGRGGARPAGVARNTLEAAGYADVDLRVSRDLVFGKGTPQSRTVTVGLDAFNVLNRANFINYVGTIGSPLFQQPVAAKQPRQLQLSARVKF